jgi:hypothetical protein
MVSSVVLEVGHQFPETSSLNGAAAVFRIGKQDVDRSILLVHANTVTVDT